MVIAICCPIGDGQIVFGQVDCITVRGGPQVNVPCVFPFKFRDKEYNKCTTVADDNNKPWCSTKVDSNGFHIGKEQNWGYCGPQCPTEGT